MTLDERVLLADVDRDRAAADLHAHHAAGRLGVEDLEERLDAVWSARTHGDLAVIFEDLPTPAAGTVHRRRGPGWHPLPFLPILGLILVVAIATGHPWVLLLAPVVAVVLVSRRRRWGGLAGCG